MHQSIVQPSRHRICAPNRVAACDPVLRSSTAIAAHIFSSSRRLKKGIYKIDKYKITLFLFHRHMITDAFQYAHNFSPSDRVQIFAESHSETL